MTTGQRTLGRGRRRAKRKAAAMNGARRGPSMVSRNRSYKRPDRASQARQSRPLNLQLATEGAELKLPALPRIHIGWRALSAITAVWLLVILLFAATSPSFRVSQINLLGAERVTLQEISSLLGISGRSVFGLQGPELENRIVAAYPELDGVSVSVTLPANVQVQLFERAPVLAWVQSGITVWVDELGIAIIPQGEDLGLPVVEALEPPPDLIGDEFHRHQIITSPMVDMITLISQLAPEGARLFYDPELGFGWQAEGGWQAFFGHSGEDLEQRFAIYQGILTRLEERGVFPTLISVAHLHAPYYRIDY